MIETKRFPIEVVASITTGTLLCDFSDFHECAEFVVGHSIWTHEFASKPFAKQMEELIFAQCPRLREFDVPACSPEDVPGFVADLRNQYGAAVTLAKGSCKRDLHPLETLKAMCPDKPIIVVKT